MPSTDKRKKVTREWLISQTSSPQDTGSPAEPVEDAAVIHESSDHAIDSTIGKVLSDATLVDVSLKDPEEEEAADDELEQLRQEDLKDVKTFATAIKKRVPVYVPAIKWLRSYTLQDLIGDILAAITTAVMLVPQGLAYAILAGLPPVIGLYTGWMPLVVYAAMGSCKQLAVGPEALFAVLLGSVLQKYDAEEAVAIAHAMAITVGVISLLFGIFRFGFMHNIISRWVLSGFINAVALIIAFSQLDSLLGFKFEKGLDPYEKLFYAFQHIGTSNKYAISISVGTCVFLLGVRVAKKMLAGRGFKNAKYFPEVMISVILGIVICYGSGINAKGVTILGNIDGGFPVPKLPSFSMANLQEMLTDCLLMVIVGFVEATAVSRGLASKHNYVIPPNRELVAFGTANIIGAFFQTYPCFASIPRTSIQDAAGSRTCLCGFLTSCILLITIVFLTPLFYFLPHATMASIIFVAAFGLIEVHEAIFLWKTKSWKDLSQFGIAFLATFILEVELGILISVGMCIFLVLKHSATPHVYSVLGRLPNTNYFKDVAKYPDASPMEGIILIRIDETLIFANMGEFKLLLDDLEKITQEKIEEKGRGTRIQAIAINCSNIPSMDASALLTILEMVEVYHKRNVRVCFIQLNPTIHKKFELAGLIALVGEENLFESNHGAIRFLEANVIKKDFNRSSYNVTNVKTPETSRRDDGEDPRSYHSDDHSVVSDDMSEGDDKEKFTADKSQPLNTDKIRAPIVSSHRSIRNSSDNTINSSSGSAKSPIGITPATQTTSPTTTTTTTTQTTSPTAQPRPPPRASTPPPRTAPSGSATLSPTRQPQNSQHQQLLHNSKDDDSEFFEITP